MRPAGALLPSELRLPTSLNVSFFYADGDFLQFQRSYDFVSDGVDGPAAGFDFQRRPQIMFPPRLVQIAKLFFALQQGTAGAFLALLFRTPLPQFVYRGVQEDGCDVRVFQQSCIIRLHESPSTQSDDANRSGL